MNVKMNAVKKNIYEWLYEGCHVVIISIVAFVLICTFVARMGYVDGGSMLPTLKHDDRVLFATLFYQPKKGDIVVVVQPNNIEEPLIKRVIATEGQVVDFDFRSGFLFVDGEKQMESYVSELTYRKADVVFPQTVPEDCVFILGDNRNNSIDSRNSEVGMVHKRDILGKVIYRVFPLKNMGAVN